MLCTNKVTAFNKNVSALAVIAKKGSSVSEMPETAYNRSRGRDPLYFPPRFSQISLLQDTWGEKYRSTAQGLHSFFKEAEIKLFEN